MHATAPERIFGEWTQVQADHGFFQPAPRSGNNFIVMNAQFSKILKAVKC